MQAFRHGLSRPLRTPWRFYAPLIILLVGAWFLVPGYTRITLGADGTPTSEPTTLCPRITDSDADETPPATVGTPSTLTICTAAELATPLTVGGLSITVTAAQDKAGPVDLTITVTNARGEPIEDATVTVLSQHLEMNHGVSVDEAFHTGDGVYQANKVSMGMGGDWQVEVQIERPNRPVIAGIFVITLSGPM